MISLDSLLTLRAVQEIENYSWCYPFLTQNIRQASYMIYMTAIK